MGTDIHVYCEAQTRGKETWFNVDHWKYSWAAHQPNVEFLISKKNRRLIVSETGVEDDYWDNVLDCIPVYSGRDYVLFGILAGVRVTDIPMVVPMPKGIPNDVSSITLDIINAYGRDGHTHSWLTLKELKDYHNSGPLSLNKGYISQEDADALDAGVKLPESWYITSTRDWVYREWYEKITCVEPIIESLTKRMNEVFNTYEQFSEEEMKEYENKIRIVFFFDN
jgi:hypothetical protein